MKHPQTPYAVICPVHGQEFLTKQEYDYQMCRPDAKWQCPVEDCRREAQWDDANYEEWQEQLEEGSSPASFKLKEKEE